MGNVRKVPSQQNKQLISRYSGSCEAEAGQEVSQMRVEPEALSRSAALVDLLNIKESMQSPSRRCVAPEPGSDACPSASSGSTFTSAPG